MTFLRRWFSSRPSAFEIIALLSLAYHYLKTQTIYRVLLGRVGSRTILMNPTILGNGRAIRVGSRTLIRQNARIEALARYAGADLSPHLVIGDGCNIEQNVHIVCGEEITIGNRVSVTANCAIVDVEHPYANPEIPVASSPVTTRPVRIGDDVWIGIGTVVMPGTTIGRRVVIGANSTVSGTLPDYSVWAGSPARCVRLWDVETRSWRRPES